MTATDAQVRIMMRERSKGRTQEPAAVKANLSSRKTVRKYERLGKLASELKKARDYRTRSDAFEGEGYFNRFYELVKVKNPGCS
jgi:hypothetical protein